MQSGLRGGRRGKFHKRCRFGLCKVTLYFSISAFLKQQCPGAMFHGGRDLLYRASDAGCGPILPHGLFKAHRSVYDGIYADKSHLFKLPASLQTRLWR